MRRLWSTWKRTEESRRPSYKSDPDAVYAREYTFDLSKIRPVAAKPDFVDNVVPAEEVRRHPH